jgi:hypothetical protein
MGVVYKFGDMEVTPDAERRHFDPYGRRVLWSIGFNNFKEEQERNDTALVNYARRTSSNIHIKNMHLIITCRTSLLFPSPYNFTHDITVRVFLMNFSLYRAVHFDLNSITISIWLFA